jgi:hypothetical protein
MGKLCVHVCTFYVPPFLPADFKEQAGSSQSFARPFQEALLKQVSCECAGWFPMIEIRDFTMALSSSLVRPFIARKAPPGFFICFLSSLTCIQKHVFSKQDLLTRDFFFFNFLM